jgi:aspartate kinase
MALIVQKFGGTSVGNIERIRNVATKVKKEIGLGNQVVVVVSAMSGVTNQLVAYVQEVSPLSTPEAWAEYDHIVSSGEQVTSGLLALCLNEMGVPARSYTGWQIPLKTNMAHGSARIESIDGASIHAEINSGKVVVIAGFQGVDAAGRISTLGRGGSDTSAVALAAALKADRCDIYTDVDGVYTTDPRIVSNARKLDKIAYEEMLEMASLGAKTRLVTALPSLPQRNLLKRLPRSFWLQR